MSGQGIGCGEEISTKEDQLSSTNQGKMTKKRKEESFDNIRNKWSRVDIENKNKPIPSSEKLKKITEKSQPELQRFKLQRTGLWFDTDCNSQASKELRNFIESNVDEGCFYLCDTPQKFKTDIEKILKEGSEDFFIISSGQRIKEIID